MTVSSENLLRKIHMIYSSIIIFYTATVTTSSNVAYEEVRLSHRRKSAISSAHNSYKATPF